MKYTFSGALAQPPTDLSNHLLTFRTCFKLKWRKRLSIQYFHWPLYIIKNLDLSGSLTIRITKSQTHSGRNPAGHMTCMSLGFL